MFHRLPFKHCTEISTERERPERERARRIYSLIGYYDCTIRSELRFQKVARTYLIPFDLRHRFPIQSGWILNRDPNPADLLNANKMRTALSIPNWRLIVMFAPRLISGDPFKAFRKRFNPFQGVYV